MMTYVCNIKYDRVKAVLLKEKEKKINLLNPEFIFQNHYVMPKLII